MGSAAALISLKEAPIFIGFVMCGLRTRAALRATRGPSSASRI
jgi:hypothetical protein